MTATRILRNILDDILRNAAEPVPAGERDPAGLIEAAAALDGFSGPSNWLGWAAYGGDHLYPIDWGSESVEAKRAGREARNSGEE